MGLHPPAPSPAADLATAVSTAAAWHGKGHLTAEQLAFVATLPPPAAARAVAVLRPVIDTLTPGAGGAHPAAVAAAVAAVVTSLRTELVSDDADSDDAEDGKAAADAAPEPDAAAKGDVKAAAPLSAGDDADEVKEVIVLCIDRSGSMQTPFEADDDVRTKDRTRLDSVKQIFFGFRDQTTMHHSGHLLGLLSYDDAVAVHTAPTANLDVFEDVLDDMAPGGCTAIYTGISRACDLLAAEAKAHPRADFRVIVLTDGQNNVNTHTVEDAVQRLADVGAVCDAVLVGDRCDEGLRQLVTATEGECFQVDCLADAFETLESPAVISLAARRNGAPKPSLAERQRRIKRANVSAMPAAKVCKGAKVVKAAPVDTFVAAWVDASDAAGLSRSSSSSSAVQKRLARELAALGRSEAVRDGSYACFAGINADGNIVAVKVALTPQTGPYAGRVVDVNVVGIDGNYPFSAPRVTFATSVYHYAVSNQGGICLPLLNSHWSPKHTLVDVVDEVNSLFVDHATFDPDASLAIRSWLSELLRVDPAKYAAEAEEHARTNAAALPKGSVADVRAELLRRVVARHAAASSRS